MPEHTFRKLTSLDEALSLCREHLGARQGGREVVPLSEAVGRVLAAGVRADAPLPHFPRSTMDGYAVRASDTFSASAAAPVMLELVGTVQIGHPLTSPCRLVKPQRYPRAACCQVAPMLCSCSNMPSGSAQIPFRPFGR